MSIEVYPDADALAVAVAERLTGRLALLQAGGRRPSVVLTGGSIATETYQHLGSVDLDGAQVDWAGIDFYWGDERFVPGGDADRNDQQAHDAFLARLDVPADRIHATPVDDGALSATEAAESYAADLPDDPFDVVLLGLGPDGHVASLFPGFDQLEETQRRTVEVFDSPKPPPIRISMTFPTLNHADSVWFVVSGEGKADAVARALGDGTVQDTPAVAVRGTTETVWLLDQAAARGVSP